MKRLSIAFVSLLAAVACSAQTGIEWLATSYEFGTFKEVDGRQYGSVKFVNHGPEETMINDVKSSCGCTVAQYTDDVIAVGDTAEVKFSYNPAGRPGRFHKTIRVFVGADNKATSISLKGLVIGSPESLSVKYPVESGNLRLSGESLILGDVVKGISRHEFLNVYNQGEEKFTLTWENVPPCISIGVSSATIEAGDMATLSIYYNSIDDDNFGLNEHKFDLVWDKDNPSARQTVTVAVNLKSEAPKLSAEEMKVAPRIAFPNKVIDLGKVFVKNKLLDDFKLSNEGESVLDIHRVYSLNKVFEVKRMPRKLSPGKTERVEFELDMSALPEGAFNIKVEVVSSDPLRPTETIRIVGEKVKMK